MNKKWYRDVVNKFETSKDETATHSLRVSKLSKEFGEYIGLTDDVLEKLEVGAMLHDMGKYGIDEKVLYKNGSLNEDEFKIIQGHVIKARDFIDFNDIDSDVRDIILQHHERFDGKGYPYGLARDEINKLAVIVSLVDVYDALTNQRSYKKSMTSSTALEIIVSDIGIRFEAGLAFKFLSFIIEKMDDKVINQY